MEVGNEDLVQLAWPEAASHQLHLAALTTVKHPAPHLCSPCKKYGGQRHAVQVLIVCYQVASKENMDGTCILICILEQ